VEAEPDERGGSDERRLGDLDSFLQQQGERDDPDRPPQVPRI
jgi:hypothetical protein